MGLNLNVVIESGSGFCFGVRNAISKAEMVLDRGEELYCLGEIVHNEQEVERLLKKGMKMIDYEEFKNLKNTTVLFRAHGEPPSSYEIAKQNNLNVIDASCPIILKLQEKIAKSANQNEHVYIFGLHNHPEIIGLNGKTGNRAIVFEKFEDLEVEKLPAEMTLYSQTTKKLQDFYEVVEKLKALGIKVNVVDSICRQVANREEDLKIFSQKFDVIVFVSGKNSSNGKQLFGICKQENPRSYFISRKEEILTEWFYENEQVGVCGATSTPLWFIEEIKDYLLSL